IGLGIDIIPDGHAGHGNRGGVGLGGRYGLAGDRYGVLDIKIAGRVFDLADSVLDLGQYLVMIDGAWLIRRHDVEIRDEGPRLTGVVDHLIAQIPANLTAAAGDIDRDQARIVKLEVQDPNLAVGFVDIVFVLDVGKRRGRTLVRVEPLCRGRRYEP